MNAEGRITRDWRADFPGLEPGWSYLDSAATAQKPAAVIDAITRAYGPEYATVHRGIYARSATMTERYEAARARAAAFIGAAKAEEIVFVRGATEGINLVAESWGRTNLASGDRILLTQLEHHSNIVPWQLIAKRTGAVVEAAPVMADGRIDEDALIAMLDERVKIVAVNHVSNVTGAVADVARIAEAAHAKGALLLVDGCQAAPRMAVDVAALGADFYVFSGHKLYGPSGIGVLYGREDLLAAMPPYQGGGSMIETVSFEETTFAPPPGRFEAGTPHIVGGVGLHAAMDYVDGIGVETIDAHERKLGAEAREALHGINSLRLHGPEDGTGIVSFTMVGVHPHDIATILDEEKVAIRAGHHCCQPLMAALGVPATARASFGVYSGTEDVEKLIAGLKRVQRIFA